MTQWKTFPCTACNGTGVVMVYSMYDVEGPGPCTQCDEKGFIYVSEHDRLADYPGGRLRGTWPGKFNELPPLTGGQGEGQ